MLRKKATVKVLGAAAMWPLASGILFCPFLRIKNSNLSDIE